MHPVGPSHAVLVPIKDFDDAKARLADVLSPRERKALAQELAAGVLEACAVFDLFVVCDATAVATFAQDHGATVIWTPEVGLNSAVRTGVDYLSQHGYESITISHADLANPSGIATLPEHDGVIIVPDHRGDGTNVMRLPSSASFPFHYGAGSADQHARAAEEAGFAVLILRDEALGHDVDDAHDLARLRGH